MEILLLGPLQVRLDGQELLAGPPQQAAVLALLALADGRSVTPAALVDALWGDEPPASAVNVVQTYVARLRRTLGRDALLTVSAGYRLVGADVDAVRFERDVAAAVERSALRRALDLWRGPVLPECAGIPGIATRAARLEELRWTVTEDWLEAELAAGGSTGLVAELMDLVETAPLRERLRVALATALHRAGRQPDALRVCAEGRTLLRESLGLDPGPRLRAVEQAILRNDTAIGLQEPPHVPPGSPPRAPDRPRSLTSFVGRATEVAQVQGLLGRHRLLTLSGPGGIGKTRLAVEAARAVAGGFDHVAFVDLASLPPRGDVRAAVATAVGLAPRGADPEGALAAYLAGGRTLLIVDNCEHVVERAAGVVRELLTAVPSLRVLATSREPLRLAGEVVWSVPPLTVEPVTQGGEEPDAIRLLRARAEEARPGSTTGVEAAVLAAVSRQLDGLPLALELAAARIRVLEIVELAERLGRESLLAWRGDRAGPERHRTLHAAVRWSLDLLPARERAALGALSVFRGSFPVDAAEAVVGGVDAGEVVGSLVDRSLLSRQAGTRTRIRLLAPVREAAAALLSDAEADAAGRRHLAHHAALAATAEGLHGAESADVLRALDAERAEIWAAVDRGWAADPVAAAELTARLWWYAFLRGPLAEARARQMRALSACPPDRPDLQAGLLRGVAAVALAEGDFAAVTAADAELLRLAAELGDEELTALGHAGIGQAAWAQGRYAEGAESLAASVAAARRAGSAWVEAVELALLARVHSDRGDRTTALRTAESAVRVAGDVGEPMARAFASDVLAELLLEEGAVEAAEEHGDQALQLYREVGYREGVASALQRQGDIAQRRGRLATAAALWIEALAVARSLGHPGAMAQAADSLAGAFADQDAEVAVVLLGAGAALRAGTGAAPSPGTARHRERTVERLRRALGEDVFVATARRGEKVRPARLLDLARRVLSEFDGG